MLFPRERSVILATNHVEHCINCECTNVARQKAPGPRFAPQSAAAIPPDSPSLVFLGRRHSHARLHDLLRDVSRLGLRTGPRPENSRCRTIIRSEKTVESVAALKSSLQTARVPNCACRQANASTSFHEFRCILSPETAHDLERHNREKHACQDNRCFQIAEV